jgi:hypothetical protein
MSKLTRNAFIEKHRQGTVLGFDFADFRRVKSPTRQPAKRGLTKPRGSQYQRVKLREKSTGKDFPTPNQIITAFAKRVLKSDYFIESKLAGTMQAVFIADDAEAKAVANEFPHGPPKPGDGRPARLGISVVIDEQRALGMARALELI